MRISLEMWRFLGGCCMDLREFKLNYIRFEAKLHDFFEGKHEYTPQLSL